MPYLVARVVVFIMLQPSMQTQAAFIRFHLQIQLVIKLVDRWRH